MEPAAPAPAEPGVRSRAYPTDLTDGQWAVMEPYLPVAKTEGRTGRPREYSYREIINGIFYVLRTGCTWDMMPHDLPPWNTCHHYFRRWREDGTWQGVHDALRERVRVRSGREATPSAAVMDSQSVKTAENGGAGAKGPHKAPTRPSLKDRTLLSLMRLSASKDVSDIFSSTPAGSCSG